MDIGLRKRKLQRREAERQKERSDPALHLPVFSRHQLPGNRRSATPPSPARRPTSYSIIDCIYEGCGREDSVVLRKEPRQEFVRLSLGHVKYTSGGAVFTRLYDLSDGEPEGFLHLRCALEAGIPVGNLDVSMCSSPNCCTQFHSAEGEESGAYLIEVGEFYGDEFVPSRMGAIHWACAQEEWSSGLTVNIEGPTWPADFITSLEEA